MNLNKCFLTKNECYTRAKKVKPIGIMVHSTGANNTSLKRYVAPNDGKLGINIFGNHWNKFRPGGRQVCPHAFIGELANGAIATYQTLPWDYVGWHSGSGNKGSANYLGYIGFEICEDNLKDETYFNKVYTEAIELCVYLCKTYSISVDKIICHSEGYKQGIASNHADVMHWFPKFGKSMDTLRNDVAKRLTANSKPAVTGFSGVVTASSLNVRKTASENSVVVTALPKDTAIRIDYVSNSWGHISGSQYWVGISYVKESGAFADKQYTVNTHSRLNVRDMPSTKGKIIDKLENGTKVIVVAKSGNWGMLMNTDRLYLGWAYMQYLK